MIKDNLKNVANLRRGAWSPSWTALLQLSVTLEGGRNSRITDTDWRHSIQSTRQTAGVASRSLSGSQLLQALMRDSTVVRPPSSVPRPPSSVPHADLSSIPGPGQGQCGDTETR